MIILIISSYILIKDLLENNESSDMNTKLSENVIIEVNTEDKISIDWNKINEINKDIIGWIRITGTNINYPILQDNNNLKYLKHTFNGKYNKNGSIFTLNNDPFYDDETVIFDIYTKEQNYKAEIFSVYSIGIETEEKNTKSLNFEEKIKYYKKISKFSIDNTKEIKKIVKLSTCSYLNNHTTPTNQRYYIVASLKKVK